MLTQEKKLQALREKQVQDEQILGLGIMSASAAHEMGTPLSTMATIVDDLTHDEDNSEVKEELNLLTNQIQKCKNIIARLSDKSKTAREQLILHDHSLAPKNNSNLSEQIRVLAENWMAYRPKIKFDYQINDEVIDSKLLITISLEQAIYNLLDNAADASLENGKDKVKLLAYYDKDILIIDIVDSGNGIIPEKQKYLGSKIQESNKENGLGWGMFLSNVSIERAGGRVQLLEIDKGGILTRIEFLGNRYNG